MIRPARGVRRPLSLLVLFAAMTAAACASAAGSGPGVAGEVIHTSAFDVGRLSWLPQADGGVAADLPDTRMMPEPGRTLIPVRHHLLLVPGDRRVGRVVIEPVGTHRLQAPASLAVAGDILTSSGERLTASDLAGGAGDDLVAAGEWPAITSVHQWRGYQLVAVAVPALRPVGGGDPTACDFLDAYAVRVVWSPGAAPAALQRERLVPGEAEDNRRMLAELVDNPAALTAVGRQDGVAVAFPAGGFQPAKTPSLTGSPVTCLIVTSDALASAFQVLADYRTAQGMPTVVATREYIAANFRNGADIQETIRMYIRDAYAKWGVQYVLLGGDTEVLPPRIIYNRLYPPNSYTAIPCDLYFACLDGNWNADGDANYGQPARYMEPGDMVDFAEEVYLGRAPVSTPAEAVTFVQKVMTYEATAAGASWPDRALFAAEVLFPEAYHPGDTIFLDGAQFAHEQVTAMAPCTGIETLRMYETDVLYPRDLPLTRASVIDSLNTGHYGIVNQIGHGYFFNMSVGDANFTTNDADNLSNGNHQFLLYGLNCASAAFDNSCLMERFLRNPNGGAVCALGSSREAFPYAVNAYQQEFFSKLYCQSENRVGRLMALSRLPFLAATEQAYFDRWTFENYTLLGDPALALWTTSPRTAVVTAPASIAAGQRNVAVTVTANGSPVSGALVSLAKAGEDLVWGTTNASGQVTLAILAPSAGTATLKVTGPNLAIHTRSIPVTLRRALSKDPVDARGRQRHRRQHRQRQRHDRRRRAHRLQPDLPEHRHVVGFEPAGRPDHDHPGSRGAGHGGSSCPTPRPASPSRPSPILVDFRRHPTRRLSGHLPVGRTLEHDNHWYSEFAGAAGRAGTGSGVAGLAGARLWQRQRYARQRGARGRRRRIEEFRRRGLRGADRPPPHRQPQRRTVRHAGHLDLAGAAARGRRRRRSRWR